MDYYLMIENEKIPVSREIYKAYCQGSRKERYFRESDLHNRVCSYDALDTEDFRGSKLFEDTLSPSVEEAAEQHLLLQTLCRILKTLPADDLRLLRLIYGQQKTFRQAAKIMNLPLSTLYSRHRSLLNRLRTLLEQKTG